MAGEPERRLEGLYTLKYGITEQLIAEGLSGVVGAHTVENVQDRTIQGLLADQETAYNMLFADIAGGRPLTQHTLKTWHQLITRHSETTGRDRTRARVTHPETRIVSRIRRRRTRREPGGCTSQHPVVPAKTGTFPRPGRGRSGWFRPREAGTCPGHPFPRQRDPASAASGWAITAAIAAAATMSSTVAPRDRSHIGRAKPCRKGPMARIPPRCSLSL